MEDLVYALAMGVGIPLAIWLVFRGASAPPPVEGDALVLRYPRGLEVAGWVIAALGAATVGWMATSFGITSAGDAVALAVLVLFVGGAAALFFLAYRREWVRVTPAGVEGQTAFRRAPTRVTWAEVERVTFSKLSGYLSLWGPDGRRVAVSAFHRGADRLAETVGRRLAVPGAAEAVREFMSYRAGYGIG